MKLNLILFSLSFLSVCAITILAQEKPSALDNYIDNANTIVVVKCLKAGPVNILLRSSVEVEVLHVVKGREIPATMFVDSQFGMVEGAYYLLASKSEVGGKLPHIRTDLRQSVIPLVSAHEAEQLKGYSPRIVVLRSMNLRANQLESEIQIRTYELEELKKIRQEN